MILRITFYLTSSNLGMPSVVVVVGAVIVFRVPHTIGSLFFWYATNSGSTGVVVVVAAAAASAACRLLLAALNAQK